MSNQFDGLETAGPLDGTESTILIQNGKLVKATTDDVAALAAAPYLVYTALLTQTSTNAPTAIVLQNTLGATITYGYDNVGSYNVISSAGNFNPDKTTASLTGNAGVLYGSSVPRGGPSSGKIYLQTFINFTTAENSKMQDTFFEIRIYP